jgi:hypothetical protein
MFDYREADMIGQSVNRLIVPAENTREADALASPSSCAATRRKNRA